MLSCIFAKKIHLRPQQIRLLMDSPVWCFPLFSFSSYPVQVFFSFSDGHPCSSHAYLSLLTRPPLSSLCNYMFHKNCKLVRSFCIELSTSRYNSVHIFITAIDYFFRLTLSVGNDFADFKILVISGNALSMRQSRQS